MIRFSITLTTTISILIFFDFFYSQVPESFFRLTAFGRVLTLLVLEILSLFQIVIVLYSGNQNRFLVEFFWNFFQKLKTYFRRNILGGP